MKSFKEIRKTLSEEYYSGPTAYAGGDRTNVGDITGTDLGGMGSGSQKTGYPTSTNIKMIEAGLNAELAGVVKDPVTAITRARTKLNMTGLSFDLNAKDINMAMSSGEPYVVNLNFGGRALGRDPGDEERDDFADDMQKLQTNINTRKAEQNEMEPGFGWDQSIDVDNVNCCA